MKIKVTIELEYVMTELRETYDNWSDLDDDELIEEAVYTDLIDLMRGDGLESWAEIVKETN
jgi:hypothetical protein